MRKLLAIFSILTGLVVMIFLLLPILLSLFGLDRAIADYFVDKFSKNEEKILKYGEIDVGYHSIKLDNIQFISHAAGVNLLVRGLEFDYNIIDLLQNIKTPHKAINRISFVEPKIVFNERAMFDETTSTEIDTSHLNIAEFVDQFENIDRIHLKEGQILINRSTGEVLALAKNLDGWVNATDFENVHLSAFGDLLYGTEKNFNINCTLNPLKQEYSAAIDLKNFNMRNIRQIEEGDKFDISDGILSGHVEITGTRFDLESLNVSGQLSIGDLSARLYDLNFSDITIPIEISDNSLSIKNGRFEIERSSFALNGQVRNIFDPVLKGRIHADSLHSRLFCCIFRYQCPWRINI